ncbi:hypothetical protein I5Q34_04380 [Streptomyces sp. AV19]|uniref:hypothetical protein n=1 Tax=Streptomyces sp. AV19 TaxID=2793068 RepID=UPI0018FF054A|nr:hypothetical protein [Streptomyces sp. AV19]MBH1933533.1 hypothetical protein [Streptomyces sp. AV19]MDG4532187.1 hypothetical protein [Streptomyces sp. AV19]
MSDPAAAEAVTEDLRPPAYVQESHLRTVRTVREDGLFVPTRLGAAFDMPGAADLDVLQEALCRWTLRHETLRSGFRWDDDEGRAEERAPISSYVDFCGIEQADADRIDDTHAIVARWREFINRCDGRLPNFPVDLGLDPSGKLPTQKLMREMLVDADDAAAFESYCRPYGGSPAGVLAATGLIVHRIGGEPVYRTVVPFHTRVKSRWLDSVGWYVGGAPVEITTERPAGFRSVLEQVRAALRANMPLAHVPIARVLRLLGAGFRPTSPDLYSIVSFIDSRATPGSADWPEQKAYGLIRVSYGDQVCVWTTRLHEGLQFASRYPDTDIAYENMRRYVEQLRDAIVTVARQGPDVCL